MASHALMGLPAEILVRICEYLSEIHAPSVLSFAQASKSCHLVARPVLFRTLSFNITTPEKIVAHAQTCTDLLRRNHAFGHIRRVVLFANEENSGSRVAAVARVDSAHWHLGLVSTTGWNVDHQGKRGVPDDCDLAWRNWVDGTPVVDFDDFPFDAQDDDIAAAAVPAEPAKPADGNTETKQPPVNESREECDPDTAWTRLAELLQLLPGLTDLTYKSPAQFPPCLLQVLHGKTDSHRIRLHLHDFKLQEVEKHPTTELITHLGTHDLAVLTSPCLHTLWLDAATQDMTVYEHIIGTEGLAPNLREARLQWSPRYRKWWPAMARYPNPRDRAIPTPQQPRAGLQHFELGANDFRFLSGVHIQQWTQLADLTHLQSLKLWGYIFPSALDALAALHLPQLTSLDLECPRDTSQTKRFIRSLPRLETLSLTNWDWSRQSLVVDDNNADNHPSSGGSSSSSTAPPTITPHPPLKALRLEFKPRSDGVDQLSDEPRCALASVSELTSLGALYPNVEALSIRLLRSHGDAREVALYRALGASFPRLERLALTLDPPMPTPAPDGLGGDEEEEEGRYLESVMANSAIDARLAREVFGVVIAGQGRAPRLERMTLRARPGREHATPYRGIRLPYFSGPWLDGLAREWVVRRTVDGGGGGSVGDVRVEELGASRLAEAWRGHVRNYASLGAVYSTNPLWQSSKVLFWELFVKLWPGTREGSKAWFEGWESLPLAGEP